MRLRPKRKRRFRSKEERAARRVAKALKEPSLAESLAALPPVTPSSRWRDPLMDGKVFDKPGRRGVSEDVDIDEPDAYGTLHPLPFPEEPAEAQLTIKHTRDMSEEACARRVAESLERELHVYANDVTEWFVARDLADALAVATSSTSRPASTRRSAT